MAHNNHAERLLPATTLTFQYQNGTMIRWHFTTGKNFIARFLTFMSYYHVDSLVATTQTIVLSRELELVLLGKPI